MTTFEKLRFRDPDLTKRVARYIHRLAPRRTVKICHVCGTHEWTITHYGLRALLPPIVEVIAGPGCPVCILPAAEIDEAVELAEKGIVITTFGDVLRVQGSETSLLEAKAKGNDVRVVYGISDAAKMAAKESDKEFVFFAIGFETTAPSTAAEIVAKPPPNLSFLVSHRLIPPAMEHLLGIKDLCIDGFIAPGHVSTIIGLKPYEKFPNAYQMPTVVAGFEPLDALVAVAMILKQLKTGEPCLENEYSRIVKPEGNMKALALLEKVFDIEDGNWRGIGKIPASGLELKEKYRKFDAREKHGVRIDKGIDRVPGCKCHLVIVGRIKPNQCPLFMKTCTPQHPKGPCMVGLEGTCKIWARHD